MEEQIERFKKASSQIIERAKQIVKQYGLKPDEVKDLIDDMERNISEKEVWLREELKDLDPNCETCRIIAAKITNHYIDGLDDELDCLKCQLDEYKNGIDIFAEDYEPPCTAFCPVVQRQKLRDFEFTGHMEWFNRTYKHSPNCKTLDC